MPAGKGRVPVNEMTTYPDKFSLLISPKIRLFNGQSFLTSPDKTFP